jgi:hypothetical protein
VRAARWELDNLNRDFNKVNKEVAKKKIVRASSHRNPDQRFWFRLCLTTQHTSAPTALVRSGRDHARWEDALRSEGGIRSATISHRTARAACRHALAPQRSTGAGVRTRTQWRVKARPAMAVLSPVTATSQRATPTSRVMGCSWGAELGAHDCQSTTCPSPRYAPRQR